MKTFLLALVIFCIQITFSQQFHSLDGIEDNQGHTLLHYRLGNQASFEYNPVYRYNTFTGIQTYLIDAYDIPDMGIAKGVNDFEFFPGDTSNNINVGYVIYPDNHGYIARNDSVTMGGMTTFTRVDISKQNPNKVFVFGQGTGHVRSWDGGYTFPEDSIPAVANFVPISLADFDDNVEFGLNE